MGTVTLDMDGAVGTIWLDSPGRRNAMSLDMWHALRDCVDAADGLGARLLVVSGRGQHFSAGMDLKPDNPAAGQVLQAILEQDPLPAAALIRELKSCIAPLTCFPGPTVAAIEGCAVGGGLEIALGCDVRVAASDARLGLPEVRLGMIPDLGGTVRLARLVGQGRAAWMVCGGDEITGEDAYRFGIVEQVAAPGGALAGAAAWARSVLRGGPRAVRLALGVLRGPHASLEASLDAETTAGAAALASGEPVSGLRAFSLREAPEWLEG